MANSNRKDFGVLYGQRTTEDSLLIIIHRMKIPRLAPIQVISSF